jgi:hypothetical protein
MKARENPADAFGGYFAENGPEMAQTQTLAVLKTLRGLWRERYCGRKQF